MQCLPKLNLTWKNLNWFCSKVFALLNAGVTGPWDRVWAYLLHLFSAESVRADVACIVHAAGISWLFCLELDKKTQCQSVWPRNADCSTAVIYFQEALDGIKDMQTVIYRNHHGDKHIHATTSVLTQVDARPRSLTDKPVDSIALPSQACLTVWVFITLKECRMNKSLFMLSISHESSEAYLAPVSRKREKTSLEKVSVMRLLMTCLFKLLFITDILWNIHCISQCWIVKCLEGTYCLS